MKFAKVTNWLDLSPLYENGKVCPKCLVFLGVALLVGFVLGYLA